MLTGNKKYPNVIDVMSGPIVSMVLMKEIAPLKQASFPDYSNLSRGFHADLSKVETVQDFLIKLDIKPLMNLLEISTFSLNNVIV